MKLARPTLVFEGEESMIAAISEDPVSFKEGGPIGLVQNGEIITKDISKKRMDVQLTDEELNERRKAWTPPAYKAERGCPLQGIFPFS
ncbi:dihydroxy-acid dehydratase, chloroplastic [Tanacetum coccineum]